MNALAGPNPQALSGRQTFTSQQTFSAAFAGKSLAHATGDHYPARFIHHREPGSRGARRGRPRLNSTANQHGLASLFGVLAPANDDDAQKYGCHNCQNQANCSRVHRFFSFLNFTRACGRNLLFFLSAVPLKNLRADHILFSIGSRSLKIRTITGPTVTTNSEGRMKKNMGNTSFTPSFAAFSSAC